MATKSELVQEAKRICPHLDVSSILCHYEEQTQYLRLPSEHSQRSNVLGQLAKGPSQNGRESKEVETLSLMCRIPVWRDGNHLKVCKPIVKTLPWTHVYAPVKAQHMICNSKKYELLKEWLLSWPQDASGTRKGSTLTKKRTFVKTLAQMKENIRGSPSELDYFSSDDEDEDVLKFPNVVLLYGCHGVGKTATVYACAAEVGLEVRSIVSYGIGTEVGLEVRSIVSSGIGTEVGLEVRSIVSYGIGTEVGLEVRSIVSYGTGTEVGLEVRSILRVMV